MLCSVLIASRKRFDKLLKCIESIYAYATPNFPFEIIVRFHESDVEAKDRRTELARWDNVWVIWGEDLNGYDSLGAFYHELIQAAKGQWCWHLNDDMVVTATRPILTWNERLRDIKDTLVLVQPELHQLNNSVYVFDKRGPAPIHPRDALGNVLLQPGCGSGVDTMIYTELVEKRQWPVRFLEGIGVHHQWGGVESHVT